MLTEQEALQKRCPVNPYRCIASECMAWRWGEGFTHADDCAYWDFPTMAAENCSCEGNPGRRGFCGLAGEPR